MGKLTNASRLDFSIKNDLESTFLDGLPDLSAQMEYVAVEARLDANLWDHLRGSLYDSLYRSLYDSLHDSLRSSLYDSLENSNDAR